MRGSIHMIVGSGLYSGAPVTLPVPRQETVPRKAELWRSTEQPRDYGHSPICAAKQSIRLQLSSAHIWLIAYIPNLAAVKLPGRKPAGHNALANAIANTTKPANGIASLCPIMRGITEKC